jgi:hypothetical protein
MATHERIAYEQGRDKSREIVAAWMIKHGFATGHGDTLTDLLEELSWQVAEIRAKIPYDLRPTDPHHGGKIPE